MDLFRIFRQSGATYQYDKGSVAFRMAKAAMNTGVCSEEFRIFPVVDDFPLRKPVFIASFDILNATHASSH